MFRVHTAGSVGGTTGIVASHHVQAGVHKRVMAVAFEKQSEGNAQFALGSGRGASLGAGGAFAPFVRSYIARSGAPEHIGWQVAVKDRQNALEERVRAPQDRGHLDREGARVPDDVGADPLPRVVPVVGRRVRGDLHRRGRRQGGGERRPSARVGARHRGAQRARQLPRARRGAAAGRDRLRVGPLRAGRHHQPARADRHGRAVRAVQLVRADLARRPRHRRRSARVGRWSTAARPRSAARSR